MNRIGFLKSRNYKVNWTVVILERRDQKNTKKWQKGSLGVYWHLLYIFINHAEIEI